MKQISKGKYLMLKALQKQAQNPEVVEISDEEYNELLSYQDINISNEKIPTTLNLFALDVEEVEDNSTTINYIDCDFGVDGIGYVITSLANSTVSVKKIFVGGNVEIPNTVFYNNRTFAITGIENLYDSALTSSIKFNDYINVTGRQLYGCGTSAFFVSNQNPNLSAYNGVLYNANFDKIISYPEYKSGDDFTLPNTVLTIDEYAFGANKYLKNLTFAEHTVNLPTHFMYGGNEGRLKSLILSDNITTINSRFFAEINSLESLSLPANLTLIEKERFGTYQSIPTSVKNITIAKSSIVNMKYNNDENENYILYNLKNLTELHVTDKNPVTLQDNVVTEGKLFTVTLYIPRGTRTKYLNTGWNKFYNIVEEGDL